MPEADARPSRARAVPALRWAVAAASAGMTLLAAFVVARRIGHPFELEWLEGAVLQHVEEIRAGRSVYVEPSERFAPFYYTPLYYYASALAMSVLGEGFVALRVVSLAATLACCGALFAMVRRETGDRIAALTAVGTFAAGYWWTGRWFEVGRVDMLSLGLVLGGAYALRFARGRGGAAAAGVLLAAAVLAKQTAAIVALPVLAWAAWRRRDGVALAAFAATLVVAGTGLAVESDGWVGYCLFTLSRGHPFVAPRLGTFWSHDVLLRVPFALALVALARASIRTRGDGFYPALALGLVAAGYLPRVKVGGYENNLLPVFAAAAIGTGLALGRLATPAGERAVLALALALAQLAWSLPRESPLRFVPTAADRAAGEAIVKALGEARGDVLVPTAPYLAARAGKAERAHHMNLEDLVWSRVPERERVLGAFAGALADGRYERVVLNNPRGEWLVPLPPHYEYRGRLFARGAFEPTSGTHDFVPAHLYVLRR